MSPLGLKVARDMSTILNSTAEGGRERPAPKLVRIEPPQVMLLAPGLYHGFGHYPLNVRSTPEFLVPSVFTKSKWTRRILTLHERLLTLDFPESKGTHLTIQMMQDILRDAIPGKSLLAVWEVTGGRSRFATRENDWEDTWKRPFQVTRNVEPRSKIGENLLKQLCNSRLLGHYRWKTRRMLSE